MKFMSTFVFLGIYMAVLASQRQIEDADDGASWRGLHVAFCVFAVGNLLEAFEVLAMKYRNSAGACVLAGAWGRAPCAPSRQQL